MHYLEFQAPDTEMENLRISEPRLWSSRSTPFIAEHGCDRNEAPLLLTANCLSVFGFRLATEGLVDSFMFHLDGSVSVPEYVSLILGSLTAYPFAKFCGGKSYIDAAAVSHSCIPLLCVWEFTEEESRVYKLVLYLEPPRQQKVPCGPRHEA